MATLTLTQGEADVLNNLMPGNQLTGLGTKVKYALDQLGVSDTDGLSINATVATGLAIAGTQTTALGITATATTGISVGGTNTTGVYFTGAKTNAINFAGVTTSTNTDGWLVSTGSTWITSSTAGACAFKLLCGSSATSGDYATLRIRARSDAANPAGGIVGGNFSASANIADYGNLYAVQGYAQPNALTQAGAANILCGVYSCIDRTGSSNGRSWSMWTDDHSNAKAGAGHYLHRLSNNSTNSTVYDGIWTVYAGAGCNYLMTFENTNAPVATGDKTGGGKDYALAVYVDGAARYIQLYS
jgi:hypothetical protein